jgi:glycosyltransferase involved in cell wall biosynthesis
MEMEGIEMAYNLKPTCPPKSVRPDLSLVISCYNETDVIRNTVVRLAQNFQEKNIDVEPVLVDNGSTDYTWKIINEVIAKGLPIVKGTVKVNQGYGHGVLRALQSCNGMFVGFTCADGQVEAKDVVKVYEFAAHSKSPKLVKVRRRFRMDGIERQFVSIIYNPTGTIIFFGLGPIDINGNPKIFNCEYLENMSLESKDWFLDVGVMIKAKWLGLEVFEFNVMAQMREGGTSHGSPSACWEFLVNLLKYRVDGKRRFQVKAYKTTERKVIPNQLG